MNVTPQDIWNCASELTSHDADSAWELLESLFLGPPSDQWEGYWCTPLNVTTFACTGADGAHFGLLETDGGTQPIILVAPDSHERPCVVVGESMHEFLSLGCKTGFGLIVELPHRPAEIVNWLEAMPADDLPQGKEAELLQSLSERFELHPWTSIGDRLFQLQEQYLELLDMPD